MFLPKTLSRVVYFKSFNHLKRCISSFMAISDSKRIKDSLMVSKSTLNYRFIANCNEKRNDMSRGDVAVSQTFVRFKYLRLIKNSVREFGPIIEENQKLASIIKNAQNNNLPSEFINFAIKISCDVRAKVGLYDVLLPSGCHFLIQYEDIDSTTTKHHLLELCDKYDGNLFQGEAKWPQSFDQKGIIIVRCNNSDPFSNESHETVLSKIGADSIHKEIDAEGIKYWKFYCDPWQLHDLKKCICEITSEIEEAFVGYIPKSKVNPSHIVKNYACNLFIELGKVPTVDNVYHNVIVSE